VVNEIIHLHHDVSLFATFPRRPSVFRLPQEGAAIIIPDGFSLGYQRRGGGHSACCERVADNNVGEIRNRHSSGNGYRDDADGDDGGGGRRNDAELRGGHSGHGNRPYGDPPGRVQHYPGWQAAMRYGQIS
jgi:hypothetical protein